MRQKAVVLEGAGSSFAPARLGGLWRLDRHATNGGPTTQCQGARDSREPGDGSARTGVEVAGGAPHFLERLRGRQLGQRRVPQDRVGLGIDKQAVAGAQLPMGREVFLRDLPQEQGVGGGGGGGAVIKRL